PLHHVVFREDPHSRGDVGRPERVLAACLVPDAGFGLADADAVLHELQDPSAGLAALERVEGRGGQPASRFLSTRQTLNMLFRAAREAVSEPDRNGELAKRIRCWTTIRSMRTCGRTYRCRPNTGLSCERRSSLP